MPYELVPKPEPKPTAPKMRPSRIGPPKPPEPPRPQKPPDPPDFKLLWRA